jgi:hypothetical protein
MMRIIDDDPRMPTEIANDLGFIGSKISKEDMKAAVDDIIIKNQLIV